MVIFIANLIKSCLINNEQNESLILVKQVHLLPHTFLKTIWYYLFQYHGCHRRGKSVTVHGVGIGKKYS